MRRIWFVLAVTICLVGLSWAEEAPAEKDVKSKVTSVALFKNGLAVVKRQINIEGPGTYRLADVPEPVHGTFWVESNGPVDVRVESRDTPAEPSVGFGVNLQEELAGLKVTVHGKNNKNPIMGTVAPAPKKTEDEDDAETAEAMRYRGAPQGARFLILKTDKGYSYVDFNDIAAIESEGQPQPHTVKKAVLLLTAGEDTKPGIAQISYLAHGLSWAPSYRVDLTDPKKLTIEQHAVIRNELTTLKDTEVSVISGYPSVQFNNVVSPLAARQTWTNFFNQLNGASSGRQQFDNSMMTQNAYAGNRVSAAVAPAIAPNTGDTIDLFFKSIGPRTLKKGSSIALTTGKGEAEYERIVDWRIPDNRDEWGHPTGAGRAVDPGSGELLQDDIWDALKFKNPLPFPMTSAPAMVVTAGNFSGQRSVLWTNKGEEATLRVNKALSIRAKHVEYENQTGANGANERDVIYIGGRRFRKVTVNGELRLCNHRPVDAKLIIKRYFSGDLVKSDADPKIDLREEGVWTVNKRNELTWTIKLKPAEEQTIKYQYTVLIHF